MIISLTGPTFSAGVVLDNGRVIRAAPILRFMLGWTYSRVIEYAEKRAWRIDEPADAA